MSAEAGVASCGEQAAAWNKVVANLGGLAKGLQVNLSASDTQAILLP